MKNSIALVAFLFVTLFASPIFAQKPPKKAELTIEVSGNCGMCERRINNALDVKGVMFSKWDRYTKKAEIVYNPRKITEKEIHDLIAATGHDTNLVKAKDEVYKKLPGCCLYRDNDHPHED